MFGKHIRNFANTLSALRSFVELVGPFLISKAKEIPKQRAKDLAPILLAVNEIDPELLKEKGLNLDKLRKELHGNVNIKKQKTEDGFSVKINVRGSRGVAFNTALKELSAAQGRVNLLLRSALISLISSVECFLAQVIYTYYEAVPGAMSEKDKVYSLDDLKEFDSITDARTHLIERRVTEVMRGSFSDWIDFFKGRPKLTMSYLDPYMDILIETCERRNLLVYNDGIVNSIYLSKVARELRKGIKKDSQIDLTKKYLDDRIDYFELYSILIAAELWKQINAGDHERAESLIEITYEHLLAKRWKIANGLAYFQMNDKQMRENYRLVATLNYWLSIKRENKWDSVKKEVEAADFSAKGMKFQLALFSLKDQNDEFFKMLPRAIKCGDINENEIIEFPIFEEMRQDHRFSQFTKKIDRKKNQKNCPKIVDGNYIQ